jgi:UDP:flavonoid glycosyltransferase YjiC (YdhE family)
VRLLVTSVPGIGHLLPVLPVELAAAARGHDVAVGCGASLATLVERSGLRHIDLGPPDLDTIRAELPGFAAMVGRERARRMYREGFASVAARAMARGVLRLADRWPPDLIVHDDMEMGSWIAAERLGIRHVSVQASAWRPWHRELLPEPLNEVRRELGLPPDPELRGRDGARWFTTRPVSMRDPAAPLPEPLRELRPEPDDRVPGHVRERPGWLDEPRERPRVAVTLGTVNAGRIDILRPIIEGVAARPLDLVVALGADPASLGRVPPNVRVEPYVPMSDLAPWADVVVHHAGAGTTLASLAAGRPMVVIPLTADQFDNTADALRTGAAIELTAGALTPESAALAVHRVLDESAYPAAARAVAAEIAAMPRAKEAWLEIEKLARPIGATD